MTATFFGHSDAPEEIEPKIREILADLIMHHGVESFYVGNHGNFDAMVRRSLRALQVSFPQIHYAVVLAYMPQKRTVSDSDTIFPEGLERVLPKYAIIRRNEWMIKQSDIVVTYVKHPFGGARQFKELAEKKKKIVVNLAELG